MEIFLDATKGYELYHMIPFSSVQLDLFLIFLTINPELQDFAFWYLEAYSNWRLENLSSEKENIFTRFPENVLFTNWGGSRKTEIM